ncbi:MAG: carboxypeptidase regulatory-like domain-containing protein [Bacteroidales bacterium]|nr:carboxypeptidase regulatory-like domain-containing protein [Bacteroidales bacterium]
MAFSLCVSVFAQVTTASFIGQITDANGQPVVGAVVVATHTPSGTSYFAAANNDGRVAINGMRSGGPYSVEISCLGYRTVTYTDITLNLADTYVLRASLEEDTEMLSEALVISTANTRLVSEQSGVATNIRNDQITALPSVSRSITDYTKLSPYGGNGMSFAGTDGRTANFTVDGANFNNNFGLSDDLPGGGDPISIDAIEEMQVVISPYDVRQANFIGGGVNAITKSGTNQFKGSAYVYHRNENMGGDTVDGTQITTAREKSRHTTYGFTLGGPIVKNKLFFFASFEYQYIPTVVTRWRGSEDGVSNSDNSISRTTISDLQNVQTFMKEHYGYDTGSYTSYPADESNMKILARLDWNINDRNHLAVRYNYTLNREWNSTNSSSSDCATRQVYSRLSEYSMAFANSMYSYDDVVHTISLDLNSRINDKLSNQLLGTFSILDDIRGSNSSKFPFVDILDGTGTYTPYMSLGYELFTWNNGVHNRVVTVKDDLTYLEGSHKMTFGVNYEYQMADNSYMRNGTGYYRYNSLDDFYNGATPETIAITYGYDGEENPAARVRYHKVSLYAQDEWDISPRVQLTYGLRLEGIFYDNQDLMTNNAILGVTGGNVAGANYTYVPVDYTGPAIDTGIWPKPKLQLSPRIGVNWDVLGNNTLKIRGGTGLFAGRLPLVFFTNMPTNSGMVQNLVAVSAGSDANNAVLGLFNGGMTTTTEGMIEKLNGYDPIAYPLSISPEDGVLPSTIQAVDPHFKMPKVWKTSIAIDYNFPTSFPMSLTGEFIYNKTINATYLQNLAWKSSDGYAQLNGADGRHIFPSNHSYTYQYYDSQTGELLGTKTMPSIYYLTNNNKGYGWSASAQFKIQPWRWLSLQAAYTHTVSKELTGMPGSSASSAFEYIPTYEGPNNPVLHNSSYMEPDRFYASLTLSDKGNNHYSLYYETWRGGYNYSYMTTNDVNGDGYNYDVIYIPSDSEIYDTNKVRFVSDDDRDRFWAYVNNDKYLSKHKGQYAEAYSVYSPWVHRLDFRYTHDFKIKAGNQMNTLQLIVDIKNVMNIFNSSWGVAKYMNSDLNSGRILTLDKIDSEGYPVYSTPAAVSGSTQTWTYYHAIGQCWYAQVGIKYMFN